jgi:osmotically-inducible protein OsmY
MTATAFSRISPLLLAAVLGLAGCAEAVVGSAVVTGATAHHDRRSAGAIVEDKSIKVKLFNAITNDAALQDLHYNSAVYNGRVLLTGEAPTQEAKDRAGRLAQGIANVKQLHNELTVGPASTLSARANDSFISSKVNVALFDIQIEGFDITRVDVTTEAGTVFLMGLVTRAEADAVVDKARRVAGVKRVVKLFDLLD